VRRRLAPVALLAATLAATLAVAELESYDRADVTNFRLGPGYAQWLVGPVVHMASADERRQFLALTDDEAADAFIAAFWERRGPNLAVPPSGPKVTFEARAEEADRRFTEATYLGRHTDRGTVFILYGEPTRIDFASSPREGGPPVEVWSYAKSAAAGLDGERPDRRYAFRRNGPVTTFFPVQALGTLRLPTRRRSGVD
jgi:GWxTD domain-containing protein